MSLNLQKSIMLTIVIASFGMTGCDIISSITESFSKDKSKTTAAPVPPAPNSSVPEINSKAKAPAEMTANDLAVVGSWKITTAEFEDRLKALKEVVPDYDITDKGARKMVLDELVRQQLLVEDAQSSGVAKNKDIDAAVEEFRRSLIVREIAKKLTENIQVTDDEAKALYEEKKDQLVEPAEWRIREIVVNDEAKGKELLIQILNGGDFAEIAKQHSVSASKEKGGDLGFIDQVPFPQMANVLQPLEVGGVSGVFKGPDDKFYIVKVEEKKGGTPLEYETIKEDLKRSKLILKQQDIILKHIDELKQKIKVQINENLL